MKHWQVFLLFVGIYVLTGTAQSISYNLTKDNTFALYIGLTGFALWGFLLVTWMWVVAKELYKKLPPGVNIQTGRFRFFLLILCLYIVFILALPFVFRVDGGALFNAVEVWLFLLPHFLGIYSLLNCAYYITRLLKTVELQREAKLSEFIGDFMLLWVFWLGIWFIQPRINRVCDR